MHRSAFISTSILSIAGVFSLSHAWSASQVAGQSRLSASFFRKWRIKPDKSLTRVTFKPEGNATKISVGPDYYTFNYDGKNYQMSNDGYTVSWHRPDNNTLESAIKLNNDVIITAKWVISPDDKTMTVTNTFKNIPTTTVAVYEKVSGGIAADPVIGVWQLPDNVAYEAFTLQPAGNGIRFTSSFGADYTCAFDDQEHPVTGSNYPPGTTVALKWIDDHAYEETWKRHGVPFARSQFALSSDGAVLTETWTGLRSRLKKAQPRVVTYGK